MQQSFYNEQMIAITPLAERLRPRTLDDYVGQRHLLGEGKVIRRLIDNDQVSSMIFWGPPGTGKTTLARIIAIKTKSEFIDFSAVTSGIKEIKEVMAKAESMRRIGVRTILFIDEIHRFNKAQQDAFLPYVEKGSIVLIGATTENPSFEINSALLSRCKVFVLNALEEDEIADMLSRAIANPFGFGSQAINISEDILTVIARFANGDARVALSTLEMVILNGNPEEDGSVTVSMDMLEQCISRKSLLYDKQGEEHYNIISALHKSMRNSDAHAAVYWLSRMLEAGENPLYVARRLVRFASEDIGLADSNALLIAIAAYQASHFIGMPECSDNLTQAVIYMALAPKSNALTVAYSEARRDALETFAAPVPLQIRNAPTKLMEELEYGKDYMYAHDFEGKITRMQCLPDSLKDRKYYRPTNQGREAKYKEQVEKIDKWRGESLES